MIRLSMGYADGAAGRRRGDPPTRGRAYTQWSGRGKACATRPAAMGEAMHGTVWILAMAGVDRCAVRARGGAAEPAGAHAFGFTSIEGEPLPLRELRRAGRCSWSTRPRMCGFTYQYAALQRLWAAYRERGLVVLGVPSNDFGGQEPGSADRASRRSARSTSTSTSRSPRRSMSRATQSHPLFAWLRQRARRRAPGRAGTSTNT